MCQVLYFTGKLFQNSLQNTDNSDIFFFLVSVSSYVFDRTDTYRYGYRRSENILRRNAVVSLKLFLQTTV